MNNSPNISATWFYLILCICFLLNIFFSNNDLLAQDFREQYDEIREFNDGWATVRKGDKWGVINEKGRLIAPIQYASLEVVGLDCDVMGLLIDGDYCFVDNTRIRCYNQLKPFDKTGKARVYNNGLWGFINKKGQEILAVEYSSMEYFRDDGLTVVRKKDDTQGVVNESLDFVIPSIYTRINHLHPKYFRVYSASSKSYGLIDKKGKIVLPVVYENITSIHNTDFIFVRKTAMLDESLSKDEHQFFDPQSQKLSPKIYEHLQKLTDGPDFRLNPQFIAKKDGKYGLIGGKEEAIVPFEYDLLTRKGSKLQVTKDKKVGLLDFKGNIIVPIEYDGDFPRKNKKGFFNHQKLLATCSKNGKYGVIDTAYQMIIPFKYDNIKILNKNEIIARKGKKAGLINYKREVIIPFEYTNIKRSGLKKSYIVSHLEGNNWRTALMDSTRNMIVPFEHNYQSISKFENGKAKTKRNGKLGFIDTKGQAIIPAIYDQIGDWNSLMITKKNGKVGIIDSTGQIFIEPIYDQIFTSSDKKIGTIFRVYKNNKVGIIKRDKTVLVPPNKYDKILSLKHLTRYYISNTSGFANKYMIIVKDDKKGLINHKGEEILPPILDYDHISTFDKNDFAIVNKGGKTSCMCSTCRLVGGKWGIINLKGEEVLPLKYDRITGTNNAYILTKDTTFYAYYPPKNNLSDAYNEVGYHFVQNIIMAKNGKKWAVFHKIKGEILAPQFDNVRYKKCTNRKDAEKSKAVLVEKNGKWGAINTTTGALIVPPKYTDIKFVSDNLLAYNIGKTVDICLEKEPENGLWGLLDLTGKEVTPAKYDIIDDFSEGLVFVNIGGKTRRTSQGVIGFGGGGKWGAIDSTGKVIIPLIYCNGYPTIFENGYVTLSDCSKQKNNKIILDTKGASIFAEKYDRFYYINGLINNIIAAQKGNKWKLLDLKKGKPINDKWYDKFFGIRKNIITATRDGQKYEIDINGQEQELIEENK